MAMMIQKFHKLIQSRVLWGAFLILVCISFVGLYLPTANQNSARIKAAAEGELFGKPVSQEDFRRAYQNSYLRVAFATLNPPRITEEMDARLRNLAWRRLVSLDLVRKLNIHVGDDEVVARIQQNELFNQGGRFNQAQYNLFVQRFLSALGVSERQYEEHTREEIELEKLRVMVAQGALVPPSEIQRRFHMLKDEFVVDYITLDEAALTEGVTVSEKEARAFFEANQEQFRIPDMVSVSLVQFDVDEFLDAAEPADEDEALDYYEANRDLYTHTVEQVVTNAVEEDGLATNVTEAAATTTESEEVTEPFDEVKGSILANLKRRNARTMAAEKATDLVVDLTPDRNGEAKDFDAVVKTYGREVVTLEPFSENEVLLGTGAGPLLNRAAFALEDNDEQYFSDAIIGEDAVYVLKLNQYLPSRLPSFEEARSLAEQGALDEARANALAEKSSAIRDEVVKALASGKSFEEAVVPTGAAPAETEPFSAATGLSDMENGDLLTRAVINRNAGELTDPLPVPGGVLLAYVKSRNPANPADLATLRPQIQNALRQRQAGLLYEQWEDYLLNEAGFKDRRDAALSDEPVADATDDTGSK